MAKKRSFDLDAYPFVVRRLSIEEGGGYLVEYTDIPYCIADGKTAGEAIRQVMSWTRGARSMPRYYCRIVTPGSRPGITRDWWSARNVRV